MSLLMVQHIEIKIGFQEIGLSMLNIYIGLKNRLVNFSDFNFLLELPFSCI